jgi:hypothetical protein
MMDLLTTQNKLPKLHALVFRTATNQLRLMKFFAPNDLELVGKHPDF